MEGPRHQHLHQEWQEPLEEPLARRLRLPSERRAGVPHSDSAKAPPTPLSIDHSQCFFSLVLNQPPPLAASATSAATATVAEANLTCHGTTLVTTAAATGSVKRPHEPDATSRCPEVTLRRPTSLFDTFPALHFAKSSRRPGSMRRRATK